MSSAVFRNLAVARRGRTRRCSLILLGNAATRTARETCARHPGSHGDVKRATKTPPADAVGDTPAATAQAAATGNTSPASTSTAKQLLEMQAVFAMGGWLQQQAQEANFSANDHVAPAFSTTASSDNTPVVPALDTTEGMGTTTASRKRVRKQNEEPTAAPDTSCLAQNIAATSQALATDHSSEGNAGTSPKAPTATATAPAPRKRKSQARSSQWKQHRTSETHTAEAPAALVPRSSPVTVPRPCPSPSYAEVDFITVVSKAAQRRAREQQAAAVVTDSAVLSTALYCPSATRGSFRGSPCLVLAAALAGRPRVVAVHVNHHHNIVAADAASPECLRELLTIAELNGIPVTAREPADRHVSTGFMYGVDGNLTNTELLRGHRLSRSCDFGDQGEKYCEATLRKPLPTRPHHHLRAAATCAARETTSTTVPAVRSLRPRYRGMPARRRLRPLWPPTPGGRPLQTRELPQRRAS
ncbi:hypothetical protein HPB51_008437 [Rhipicephalus microplus]|uniref:Uncharacterized protein n=1 Tax=Rhipicephalus microplus TaxID=6941 RepID=A0A9J6EFI3_RHIMP|nr:hypothetical protein HPB51_008437 [Rhipicephalus microplus]